MAVHSRGNLTLLRRFLEFGGQVPTPSENLCGRVGPALLGIGVSAEEKSSLTVKNADAGRKFHCPSFAEIRLAATGPEPVEATF